MLIVVTAEGLLHESPLTTRELDILNLCAKGLQQKQIATQLHISPETVKRHLKNCYKKLKVHNKVQALHIMGML